MEKKIKYVLPKYWVSLSDYKEKSLILYEREGKTFRESIKLEGHFGLPKLVVEYFRERIKQEVPLRDRRPLFDYFIDEDLGDLIKLTAKMFDELDFEDRILLLEKLQFFTLLSQGKEKELLKKLKVEYLSKKVGGK